jgi:hypothetical protein
MWGSALIEDDLVIKADYPYQEEAVEAPSGLSISERSFGQLPSGESAQLYTLTNANDMQVSVSD